MAATQGKREEKVVKAAASYRRLEKEDTMLPTLAKAVLAIIAVFIAVVLIMSPR